MFHKAFSIQDIYGDDYSFVLSEEHVKNKRSTPDIYLQSVKKLRLRMGYFVAVEDRMIGISAAKSASLET